MMRHGKFAVWSILILSGNSSPLIAGMPSPELVFSELGRRRWEEISFFLVGFLAMAGVVQCLWNFLRRDLKFLPPLSYRRSLTLLVLWGLLMTVVLALVSGARELMTPGAWEPKGVTFKLSEKSSKTGETITDESRERRRTRLDNLRFALWQFAKSHEDRFPTPTEIDEIGADLWLVEPPESLKYIYVPNLRLKQPEAILVYEPEIFNDGQYVLLTSGAIAWSKDLSHLIDPSRVKSTVDARSDDGLPDQ